MKLIESFYFSSDRQSDEYLIKYRDDTIFQIRFSEGKILASTRTSSDESFIEKEISVYWNEEYLISGYELEGTRYDVEDLSRKLLSPVLFPDGP